MEPDALIVELVELLHAAMVRTARRGQGPGPRHHRRPHPPRPGPRRHHRRDRRQPSDPPRLRDQGGPARTGAPRGALRARVHRRTNAGADAGHRPAGGSSVTAAPTSAAAAPTPAAAPSPSTERVARLSYFFPAHNEEANLEGLVEEALATLPSIADTFEIIAVNDGSRDAHPRDRRRARRPPPGRRPGGPPRRQPGLRCGAADRIRVRPLRPRGLHRR